MVAHNSQNTRGRGLRHNAVDRESERETCSDWTQCSTWSRNEFMDP